MRGRDLLLQRDDRVGLGGAVGDAGQAVQLDDEVAIGGAVAVIFRAFLQIIIAVGHAEAALAGARDVAGGIGSKSGMMPTPTGAM
jgi:hypothetical protein